MANIWTIARRDFRSYFTSPIAYIVIGGFMFIMDYMFFNSLIYFHAQAMQFNQFGKPPTLTDGVLRPVFGNMNVIFLFLVPFITMRLFAEEKKVHTIELLLTSPVTLSEVVLGKFCSALLLVLVMLGLTLVYPIILLITGNPDLGTIFTCYVGTLLMASCYLAIGILASSVTENQIVAGALTFTGGLFFFVISWATQAVGPVWSDLLTYLSLIHHFNNFMSGIINTSDVVYYLSVIGTGLFLTHRVLDSYRWR